jgi:hypothetical protein
VKVRSINSESILTPRFRLRRFFLHPTIIILFAIGTLPVASSARRQSPAESGLIAHEWGTFTTIAGSDGQPVEWLPVDLSGGSDLPAFVEHFQKAGYKSILRGTVRMETPVIYFYSPREIRVSVGVSFAKGLITEWYPHATAIAPSGSLPPDALYGPHEDGSITWDSVTVSPALPANFLRESTASHYYSARDTSATALSVHGPAGDQHEKFLFYRGVSTTALPLLAKVLSTGAIELTNVTGQQIPAVVLFERRGDKLGYRLVTSPQDHLILETPSVTGTFDSLRGDLEDVLVNQGLFRDEARAMVETWRDSWFEEGSRLFYIVPHSYVDSILPLSIQPAPAQLVRAFVGRIELVTPATEKSIETALAARDGASLRKYGRFLYPIFDVMMVKQTDPARRTEMQEQIGAVYE